MRSRVFPVVLLVTVLSSLTGCRLLDIFSPPPSPPTFIPATPIQLAPLNGTTVPGTVVVFSWSESPGTEDYIIAVCRGTEWTNANVVFNERIGDVTTYGIGGFANDGQLYSWKIWAENSLGFSDPSPSWTFVNGNGGGTGVTGRVPTSILVEYQIKTIVTRSDLGDELKSHIASIGSLGTITYNPVLHVYSCDAQVSGLAVEMEIHLSLNEDQIDYIYVKRTMDHGLGTWRRYDELESFSVASATIPFDREENEDRYFRLDSTTPIDFCDAIEVVDYRDWRIDPAFGESFAAPLYRIKDPYSATYHVCNDAGNYVEVRFEY